MFCKIRFGSGAILQEGSSENPDPTGNNVLKSREKLGSGFLGVGFRNSP